MQQETYKSDVQCSSPSESTQDKLKTSQMHFDFPDLIFCVSLSCIKKTVDALKGPVQLVVVFLLIHLTLCKVFHMKKLSIYIKLFFYYAK